MAQTFFFLRNCIASHKIIDQDIEAPMLVKCNDFKGEEDFSEEKGVNGVVVAAMMVACLSFLCIFRVPVMLEQELGLARARRAMESGEFQAFVVMDSLSFFLSMGVVLMMIQASSITAPTPTKRVMRLCRIVVSLAMASVVLTLFSVAIILYRNL
ncbi:hypothetical protein SUGI_0639280 [Cryptomeria japonica]|nr:hypothetical protein SUGI_0639280 [Cryptomeria japonica]